MFCCVVRSNARTPSKQFLDLKASFDARVGQLQCDLDLSERKAREQALLISTLQEENQTLQDTIASMVSDFHELTELPSYSFQSLEKLHLTVHVDY